MTTSDSEIDNLAECAAAIAHPHRLTLLEALRAGPLNVEQLARRADLSVANTSRHLQILRRCYLVESSRQGKQVFYQLMDIAEYTALLTALRSIHERRNSAIRQLRADYLSAREKLAPVSQDELLALMQENKVQVIDVRPASEYANGHIDGAINVPLGELELRLSELPAGQEIVAYCRGPHCILSFEAVASLQALGFKARRLKEGPVQWEASGLTQARQ
ncbi:ArsR/SmtB family transcription factor [Oceanobacter mangrovi]|uniref:ArsR/SmtB family transcription factor n=1 Tax=Oceanobacter mangrovi TaxID=2862510 RepID=UPI001C8EC61B